MSQTKPNADSVDLEKYFCLLIQLALIVVIVRRFQLESDAFLHLLLLGTVGFSIHYFLPVRARLWFFLILSVAALCLVLGWSIGLWVVAAGLLLLGLCHLPIPFPGRVLSVTAVAGVFAFMRGGVVPAPWGQGVWPILAAIFMFRLAVYMYDLRHERQPVPLAQRLSYFFLLPHPCFPLFPVVDFTVLRKTYYDDERHRIYSRGIHSILRGLIHLILYRFIYYHLLISPGEVANAGDVIRYVISSYLLYLRISGQFHVIVGILQIFGFNLPRTNSYYFLAHSFTDFWRRINIYWKEFIMKMVFYPVYMKVKALGPLRGMVVATLAALLVSWVLHSYQWFWLRGSFPITIQDGVFWGTLAVLVAINAVIETKYGRTRSLTKRKWSRGALAARVIQTGAMFTFMCILWSFWTAEDVNVWFSVWRHLGNFYIGTSELFGLVVGGIAFVVATVLLATGEGEVARWGRHNFRTGFVVNAAVAVAIIGVSVPRLYNGMGASVATVVNNLRSTSLNRLDARRLERGYYENLLAVQRFNSQLWEVYMNRPVDWFGEQVVGSGRRRDDFLLSELVPLSEFYGSRVLVTVNRWGMRDRDYALKPPPGCYRMAFLGTSYVMGQGVKQDRTFEALVEQRLNTEAGQQHVYEVLDFGVSAYTPLHQLFLLEQKVLSFKPDMVVYFGQPGDPSMAVRHLAQVVRQGVGIPYEYLRRIVSQTDIDQDTAEPVAEKELAPYKDEIVAWTYEEIARRCREGGAVPVWIYLPTYVDQLLNPNRAQLKQYAADAGFIVDDLTGAYHRYSSQQIRLADWDYHPNELGHRLLADSLYEALRRIEGQLSDDRAIPGREASSPASREGGIVARDQR